MHHFIVSCPHIQAIVIPVKLNQLKMYKRYIYELFIIGSWLVYLPLAPCLIFSQAWNKSCSWAPAPTLTPLIISSDLWILTAGPSLRSVEDEEDIIPKQQKFKIITGISSSVLHFYFYYFRSDGFKMQQPETTQTAQQTITQPQDPTGKTSILTSVFILCLQIKIHVKTETGYFTS